VSYKFSQQLRERLIKYLEKYHGLNISQETSDQFLDSYSDFYINFSEMARKRTSVGDEDANATFLT